MNKIILSIFILLFAFQSKGQVTTKIKSCDSTLVVKGNGHHGNTYQIAGKTISKGQAFDRINLFKTSAYELKQTQKYSKRGLILLATGMPLIIGGIIYGYQQKVSPAALIIGNVALVYVISIPGLKATKHFKKSVDLYNKEICNQ